MPTLHIIPHTHWDREWYLTFQQFRAKLVHLLDGLLDLLAADPAYRCFLLDGQTIILDDYLAVRPERRGDIESFVRAGRLFIGPFRILPDEFLVSPEATIRNLLEGDRDARPYGAKMRIGYIPDPFGHIGQMPQILRGFGIDTACLTRGLSDEPCELWWEAPDGSRVLLAYQRNSYGNAAGLVASDHALFAAGARDAAGALAPFSAAEHLLLMFGTDHQEPQAETSSAILAAQPLLPDFRLIHSSLPEYFAALAASLDLAALPVVRGELRACKRHPLLPGVLSARIWIKQRNRACETLLEKWTEPFTVWAEWAAREQRPRELLAAPAALLRPAWRLLLECHPHDSICGCSIDQVHAEMSPRFDQVEQLGEEVTRQALVTLAAAIDTHPPVNSPATPVIVFNPSSFPRVDLVSVELEPPAGCGSFALLDATGAPVPYETNGLGSRELINMRMGRKEFASAVSALSGGNVAGMKLRELSVTRNGAQARLEVALSEKGEANTRAWERGAREITALLADEDVTEYLVRARTASTVEATFVARDVPSCGYRTFWAAWRPLPDTQPAAANPLLTRLAPVAVTLAKVPLIERTANLAGEWGKGRPVSRIENEFFVVQLERNGALTLTDKRSGAVLPGLNRFLDGGDCGDEYNYAPPQNDAFVEAKLLNFETRVDDVTHVITARLEMRLPASLSPDCRSRSRETVKALIETRIRLAAGVPRIDITTEIDNPARDHRLRVHFPSGIRAQAAEYDGHFEITRRPTALPPFDNSWAEDPRPESPQRAFVAVSNDTRGLLIANRGLPEAAVTPDGDIALTLLRCIGWLSRDDFSTRRGHAGPALETPAAQMPGKWQFDYTIVPFVAAEKLAAYRSAWAFDAPLRALTASTHSGPLPATMSFLRVQPDSFVLSAIKPAEDGQGWIARGYNATDQPIDVTLETWRPFAHVERVNLAEEGLSEQELTLDGATVALKARPHEIVTLRLVE